jgi:elongation factor Ts
MSVSATLVKELRLRTGAGMMECKKALEVTQGNIDLAAEELRKMGAVKAVKKAGRTAADGIILIKLSQDQKCVVMLEVNCETDFVGRDENFLHFANTVACIALEKKIQEIEVLSKAPFDDQGTLTIEEARQALVAKIGENIHVRRLVFMESNTSIGTYLHSHRIGVVLLLDQDNPELAKDIAMHIAASKPLVVSPDQVSSDLVLKEKEIYLAQAASSGKPQEIIEKMVAGRLKKYLDEVSLLGQPFVKDPNMTVADLLNKNRSKVLYFARFEVGEGIEKEKEDFVEAVMSQVQGS